MTGRTIAAVSTPYGRGGIAVIRISGDEAVSVAERIFSAKNGKKLGEVAARSAVYGDIVDGESVIDDGIATVYRAPFSYTGEDTVEISCHGGILLTEKVLSLALYHGASPAMPGEFLLQCRNNHQRLRHRGVKGQWHPEASSDALPTAWTPDGHGGFL